MRECMGGIELYLEPPGRMNNIESLQISFVSNMTERERERERCNITCYPLTWCLSCYIYL